MELAFYFMPKEQLPSPELAHLSLLWIFMQAWMKNSDCGYNPKYTVELLTQIQASTELQELTCGLVKSSDTALEMRFPLA